MTTIRVRTSTKQAFSQAKKLEMKDSVQRLSALVPEWNKIEGWNKYDVLAGDNPSEPVVAEPAIAEDVDTVA